MFGGHFRFLVIDGIKFYPLADLCKRFDVQDLIECMQLKKDNKYKALKCDWMDANFLNRLEPSFPEMIENSTLLEEKILFDVAQKKGIDVIYNLAEDVDEQEECSQPEDMCTSLSSRSDLDDENMLVTSEIIPSSLIKGNEDVQDQSNSMEENLIGKIPFSDGRETERFFVDEEENERDSAECQVVEEPHTPTHHTPTSMGNSDLHPPNPVSNNILTPVSSEKRQIQRNLSQDFTAVEVKQKSKEDSSLPDLDGFSVFLNSLETNNNNQNASDAMVEPRLLQEVKATLSSIPLTADSEQIDQTLQRFFKSCQETCAGSHEIVTKAFVSVLKQNLILQNELNTLRSSISELKGDKEKLDAATQRCRDITKQMEDIEEVLLMEGK